LFRKGAYARFNTRYNRARPSAANQINLRLYARIFSMGLLVINPKVEKFAQTGILFRYLTPIVSIACQSNRISFHRIDTLLFLAGSIFQRGGTSHTDRAWEGCRHVAWELPPLAPDSYAAQPFLFVGAGKSIYYTEPEHRYMV